MVLKDDYFFKEGEIEVVFCSFLFFYFLAFD
jgi:hypothetical protein